MVFFRERYHTSCASIVIPYRFKVFLFTKYMAVLFTGDIKETYQQMTFLLLLVEIRSFQNVNGNFFILHVTKFSIDAYTRRTRANWLNMWIRRQNSVAELTFTNMFINYVKTFKVGLNFLKIAREHSIAKCERPKTREAF